MDILSILFIAIGLAMDAFAVSVASGCVIKKLKLKHAVKIGIFFGGFQAIMPVVGWLSGLTVKNYIQSFDHWVAFGLLSVIGGKMIWESFQLEKEEYSDPLKSSRLLLLAIATSIDALAVGITFAVLKISIILPVIIIGVITFILSVAGVYLGNKTGHLFEKKIELLGGFILIGIGVKILIEHLFFL